MTPDSTEVIARELAKEWGHEGWWHFIHPIVKATIGRLADSGYLVIVEKEGADA